MNKEKLKKDEKSYAQFQFTSGTQTLLCLAVDNHSAIMLEQARELGIGIGIGMGSAYFTLREFLRCYLQGFPGSALAVQTGGAVFPNRTPHPTPCTAIVRLYTQDLLGKFYAKKISSIPAMKKLYTLDVLPHIQLLCYDNNQTYHRHQQLNIQNRQIIHYRSHAHLTH